MATCIALYNHKGGVGKTILTVNVANALAKKGKRILLMDTDPQCNLTSYLLADDVVDDLLDNSDRETGKTIWTVVRPLSHELGDFQPVQPMATGISGVSLVPGDIRLSEFERDLADMWSDCFKRKLGGFRGVTALSRYVERLSSFGFDYVFFDCGPNLGPLNQAILLTVDYFAIPIACDLFSNRALRTLSQQLRNWLIDWRTLSELSPSPDYTLNGLPQFLGYIPQRFKTYGRTMTAVAERGLQDAERVISSDFVEVLREADERVVPFIRSSLKLPGVKDFSGTAIEAQRQGVPIEDLGPGLGNDTHKVEAKRAFSDLAQAILDRTEESGSVAKPLKKKVFLKKPSRS